MSQFDKTLTGWRQVEILYGDTLQLIAARELKDASQWPLIANINGLRPPYLTADPARASATVLLYGQMLIVPAATMQAATIDPTDVYLTDLDLTGGVLSLNSNGDLKTISGRANLRQALNNRIQTDPMELLFHPDYGCQARKLLGTVNGPTAVVLAAQYVKSAVQSDNRIQSVNTVTAKANGDACVVNAEVTPISGAPLNLSTSL